MQSAMAGVRILTAELRRDCAGNVLKIVDFGLSKSANIHSDPRTVVGTVSYVCLSVSLSLSLSFANTLYESWMPHIWGVEAHALGPFGRG